MQINTLCLDLSFYVYFQLVYVFNWLSNLGALRSKYSICSVLRISVHRVCSESTCAVFQC